MQTTLLGLAIAIILALVAALVGPHFLDWTHFRPVFEAEASRVVGLPVRVDGAIDARLLPTPSLRLHRIAAGFADAPARLAAAELSVEFSLGALMRGEWRATEMSLDGVMLTLGLDAHGRFDWPAQAGPFNAGGVTIDRLSLTGRLALRDAGSGAALNLEDFSFVGDVRPQAGALRGEGGFTAHGQRVPYRVSTTRATDGSGTRLRLALESEGWSAEADGVVTVAAAAPRFDGQMTVAQTAARVPWRLGGKVALDAAAARFDGLDGTIGADEGGVRFFGQGEWRFGSAPTLQARLDAKPFDADRLIAAFGGTPGAPLLTLAGAGDLIAAVPHAPVPVRLQVGAEAITWGGRTLQNVALEAQGEAGIWRLDSFEARAPGAARLSLNGRLDVAAAPPGFDGAATVEAADPALTWTWLAGRQEAAWPTTRPLRASLALGLGPGKLAWRGLKADIAGLTLEGDGIFDGGQRRAQLKASAPSPEPFVALLSSQAPELAELMRAAARDGATHVELGLDADTPRDEARPAAALTLRAPALAIEASLAVPAAALARIELSSLAQAPLTLRAKLAADRAGPVLTALGLDAALAATGKAELSLEATTSALAALRAPVPVRAALHSGAASLTLAGEAAWNNGLSLAGDLAVRDADIAPLFNRAKALPVSLRARATRTPEAVTLEGLDVSLLDTRVQGRLAVSRGDPATVDGDLAADSIAAAPLLALVLGVPEVAGSESLERGLAGRWRGRIGLVASRAALVEGTEAHALSLTLTADENAVTLDPIAAELGGGGRLGGRLAVRDTGDGKALDAALDVSGAASPALRYHALAMPAGRVDATLALTGKGRSLAALVTSLSGSGRVTLAGARLAGLDPAAFAIAEHAAAGAAPPDPGRLRDSLDRTLAAGMLDVGAADIAVTVRDGRLRIERTQLDGSGAAFAVSGGYDFASQLIEARGVLTATKESTEARRPELRLSWRGPVEAPLRTLDIAPLMSWIALQRVDRETRRLEALERDGRAVPETPRAAPPPPQAEPAAPPLPPAVEVRPPPGARTRTPVLRPPLLLTPN